MPLGASLKAKKGAKENTNSDLTHILGYTGTDMDIGGPPSPAGSEKEATGSGKLSIDISDSHWFFMCSACLGNMAAARSVHGWYAGDNDTLFAFCDTFVAFSSHVVQAVLSCKVSQCDCCWTLRIRYMQDAGM